jgi:hypothetical protein
VLLWKLSSNVEDPLLPLLATENSSMLTEVAVAVAVDDSNAITQTVVSAPSPECRMIFLLLRLLSDRTWRTNAFPRAHTRTKSQLRRRTK